MVTVRGSAGSIEWRLLGGRLRCPCGGVLGPWGHARRRAVAMAGGWEEFEPRRSRCRSCGRTHVLLPAQVWSRRRYGAAVIMTALVLAVRAAVVGRAAARPWLAVPGGRRQVPASTARSWRSRFALQAARLPAPSGSPAGDCLAALEALTAAFRGRPGLAAVSAHEVAAHLSGSRWLAPSASSPEFNATLLDMAAMSPS